MKPSKLQPCTLHAESQVVPAARAEGSLRAAGSHWPVSQGLLLRLETLHWGNTDRVAGGWNSRGHSSLEGAQYKAMAGSSASGGGHIGDSCMPAFTRLCGHPSADSCFFIPTFLCALFLCVNITSELKATQSASPTPILKPSCH